jgi:hypothetical protein
MENIIDKIEIAEISIDKYEENGVLCGYELNTYTQGGLNQIVFVDFRDTKKNPNNPDDFKELFLERVKSIDVDEEIELNRQDKGYREAFTLTQALKDVKRWKKDLLRLANSL